MAIEPMVSVVIPVYNGQEYIESIRTSLANQSYSDFEVIVIDDGSVDDSPLLLDNWAGEAANVKVFHRTNAGAAAARNWGVDKARGQYIAFIDVDDTVTRDYLEYLVDISKGQADIAAGGYCSIAADTASDYYKDEDRVESLSGLEGMARLLYQKGLMSVPWGYIAKKNLWQKVRFPENTKAEDMGTIYRLFFEASSVVIGRHKIYNYFQRSSNTMFSTSSVRNVDYYMHSSNMVSFVTEHCKEYLDAAFSRHFSTCFQILSETRIGDKSGMLPKIYKDIRNLRARIFRDKDASIRNRMAAFMAFISIKAMHMLLRGYYRAKVSSLGK